MIKSILGGKSKNLFDISKVVQSAKLKNNGNGTLTVSDYGVSAGILRDLCPNIKVGDTIKAYYTPISWTAPHPPTVMMISGHILDRNANPSFVVTEADLNGKVYFYNNDYAERNLPGTTVIGNIFITNDTTVTAVNYKDRYVPHELTSYKSIMKVSDVCQLVDPKYIHTIVDRGVTFTSNGDGSITVNGTPTGEYYSVGTIVLNIESIKPNHKYVVYDVNKDPIICELIIANYQGGYIYKGIGNIFTFPEHLYTRFVFEIRVNLNQTANNIVVRPQLFDLTEMFGAGNEPKTVAEFKAKFPNDYYPYSPSCFVTSFDERMPCKTKNLFSSSTEVGVPSSTKSNQSEKRLLEDGKWYIGFSKNNYYRGPQSDWPGNFQYNIWENSISIYTKLDGYGLAKCIYVEPNTKYTISYKVNGIDLNVGCGFYQEDGTYINYLSGEKITTPQNCKFIIVVFALGTDRNKVTHYVSNIQLVKGTTATDYVPYGYV